MEGVKCVERFGSCDTSMVDDCVGSVCVFVGCGVCVGVYDEMVVVCVLVMVTFWLGTGD